MSKTNAFAKYSFFPIQNSDIWDMYLQHVSTVWFPHEVPFCYQDETDWKNLTESEREAVCTVLSFFSVADGVVMENLNTNFYTETEFSEARAFYSVQIFMELNHSITYSKLLNDYIKDKNLITKLQTETSMHPAVKRKADWAIKWIKDDASLEMRLFAFAIVEFIFFQSSFCFIFWMESHKQMLLSLTKSNNLIAPDEKLHVDFANLLLTKYYKKIDEKLAHIMIKDAIEVEFYYVDTMLPNDLSGINRDMMKQFIKFITNKFCVDFGYKPLYANASNPFPFMEKSAFMKKTNFFERNSTNYNAMTINDVQDVKKVIFDEDF